MNDNVHGNRHSDGGLWRAATAGRRHRYDVFYRVTGGDGVVYGVSMLQYSNLSTTQASCRFRSKSRTVNVERILGEKGSSRPQRAASLDLARKTGIAAERARMNRQGRNKWQPGR
jgi:hypothetical protein